MNDIAMSQNTTAPTDEAGTEHQQDAYVRGRQPSDLLRLILGIGAGGVGFLLASVLDNISVEIGRAHV